jgi:phosphoglycolate phosphatase
MRKMMRICLFDIDGTLISSGGAGKAALEMALASAFGIHQLIERLQLSGRTDRAITRDIFHMHGLEDTPANWDRMTLGYLQHLPVSLSRSTGRVLPGILELLGLLQQRGDVLLGLLTGNTRNGARVKLGYFGLDGFFTFGGYGDEHLDRDDVAREALTAAQRRHGERMALDRVWVIGDTPLDIRCARSIGARVAAVATGWHGIEELATHEPDLLLQDLSDPTALLHQLES